ncbi:MAG: ferritin-like domain-containing protein [Saprospiraceae bacterium]
MKQSNGKSHEQKSSPKKEASSSKAKTLQDLFEDELKDIYWAEKALTKAIPKMINNATSQELIEALEDHLEVTEQQVARCEEVFESIGVKAVAKPCKAMEGLIKEAGEIMESTDPGSVRDAGIISAAQKVEHYEIASYGTLCAFAKQLGHEQAATLLEETLNEEKEADTNLSELAESTINQEAMSEQDQQK